MACRNGRGGPGRANQTAPEKISTDLLQPARTFGMERVRCSSRRKAGRSQSAHSAHKPPSNGDAQYRYARKMLAPMTVPRPVRSFNQKIGLVITNLSDDGYRYIVGRSIPPRRVSGPARLVSDAGRQRL